MSAFTSPYELAYEELVERFTVRVLVGGTKLKANCAQTVDFPSRSDMGETSYVRGALLARLKGITPPIKEGASVRLCNNPALFSEMAGPVRIQADKIYEVKKIHFDGAYWFLQFFETSRDFWLYPSENFEVVESKVAA